MPLYRSRQHKILAGVCGGIADWLGWSPTVVRILWIVLPPGWIAYFVMWIVMPKAPR
jgi:phage shock protein PspC (stress-responsive transcriptional regulator)